MTPLAVLLAEDKANRRQMLQDFLAQKGQQVAAAATGAEALAWLQAQAFDLLLAAYQMPGMTGWSSASRPSKWIRSGPDPRPGTGLGKGSTAGGRRLCSLALFPLKYFSTTC